METSFSSVIENEEELLADGDNLSQEDSLPVCFIHKDHLLDMSWKNYFCLK